MANQGVGTPPDWMPDSGVKLWEQVVEALGENLNVLDRAALTAMCAAYGAVEKALQDLSERGPLIEGDRGMVKNPAAQIARDQAGQFRSWCAKFGMTPTDRGHLPFELNKKDKPGAGAID